MQESICVQASNYTVYAYDLEIDALPFPMPANNPSESQIIITTGYI